MGGCLMGGGFLISKPLNVKQFIIIFWHLKYKSHKTEIVERANNQIIKFMMRKPFINSISQDCIFKALKKMEISINL